MVMDETVLVAFAVLPFLECYVFLFSFANICMSRPTVHFYPNTLFCLFEFLHTLNCHRDLNRWLLYLVRLVVLCNGFNGLWFFLSVFVQQCYTISISVLSLLLYFDLNSIATDDSMLMELLFDLSPAFQHVLALAVWIVCLALHVYRHITIVY